MRAASARRVRTHATHCKDVVGARPEPVAVAAPAREDEGAPEGTRERERVTELGDIGAHGRAVGANIVCRVGHRTRSGRGAPSRAAAARAFGAVRDEGGHAGRLTPAEAEEFPTEVVGRVSSPQAGLAESLFLGEAIVPIEGVRRMHTERGELQAAVRSLHKVAVPLRNGARGQTCGGRA